MNMHWPVTAVYPLAFRERNEHHGVLKRAAFGFQYYLRPGNGNDFEHPFFLGKLETEFVFGTVHPVKCLFSGLVHLIDAVDIGIPAFMKGNNLAEFEPHGRVIVFFDQQLVDQPDFRRIIMQENVLIDHFHRLPAPAGEQ